MGPTHTAELMNRTNKILSRALMSAILALAPLMPAHALNTRLPDLGNSAGNLMTPKAERELGQAFMRNVRKNQAVLDDPLTDDYIQDLGHHLLKNGLADGQPFHFFVIDNHEINAFAGPGGYIGTNTGLIQTTETESELAAVLAHETAHVIQHHLMRAWEAASNLSIPNAAVLLAAIAVGVVAGGDAGLATASAGQAALIQEQINFTRANEQEADRIGIDILAKAGFDANAMPAFFSRMGKATRVYASKLPEFLRTHPVTTRRIADALGRAGNYPYKTPRDDLRYQLLKVRLRQRDERLPQVSIAAQKRLLKEGRYRNRLAAQYELALLLLKAEKTGEADRILAELLRRRPEIPEFIITKARTETRLGKGRIALERLHKALVSHPAGHALNLAYADQAIHLGQYELAAHQLKQYLEYSPDDPKLYALLARATGETGDTLLAHKYQAEHHYLNGDLDEAILQLELALKTPKLSFYDSSAIESRLEKLRREKELRKSRE